jgi:HSP20 family protein
MRGEQEMSHSQFNNTSRRGLIRPTINRFWTDELLRPFWGEFSTQGNSVAANVGETDTAFWVELAIPGHPKDSIQISIEKDILKVKSEKPEDESGLKYHRREFKPDAFERSFKLPKSVDQDAISAKCENGLLVLELPKIKRSDISGAKMVSID